MFAYVAAFVRCKTMGGIRKTMHKSESRLCRPYYQLLWVFAVSYNGIFCRFRAMQNYRPDQADYTHKQAIYVAHTINC